MHTNECTINRFFRVFFELDFSSDGQVYWFHFYLSWGRRSNSTKTLCFTVISAPVQHSTN